MILSTITSFFDQQRITWYRIQEEVEKDISVLERRVGVRDRSIPRLRATLASTFSSIQRKIDLCESMSIRLASASRSNQSRCSTARSR